MEQIKRGHKTPLLEYLKTQSNNLKEFFPLLQRSQVNPVVRYRNSRTLDCLSLKQGVLSADFLFVIENGIIKLKIMDFRSKIEFRSKKFIRWLAVLTGRKKEFVSLLRKLQKGTSLFEIIKAGTSSAAGGGAPAHPIGRGEKPIKRVSPLGGDSHIKGIGLGSYVIILAVLSSMLGLASWLRYFIKSGKISGGLPNCSYIVVGLVFVFVTILLLRFTLYKQFSLYEQLSVIIRKERRGPRVLLIESNVSGVNNFHPPLGLYYLKAALEKFTSASVEILDLSVGDTKQEIIDRRILDKTREFSPDIVGLSFLTPSANNAFRAARLVKKIKPLTILIAGGHHASSVPAEQILKHSPFDCVMRRESEIRFSEFTNCIANSGSIRDLLSIKGMAIKHKDALMDTGPPAGWANTVWLSRSKNWKNISSGLCTKIIRRYPY